MNRNEQEMYNNIKRVAIALEKLVKIMDDKLIKRIDDWNKIKYPNNKETRIIIATLKPKGTVTTAPKVKE